MNYVNIFNVRYGGAHAYYDVTTTAQFFIAVYFTDRNIL